MSSHKPMNSYQKAYEYLRSEVLVDPSIQGTFLNEQDLATEIGVSRTPVREALRVLATEGLVEMLPNRGTYVSKVTRQQARDVMELRKILECHAARVSIELDRLPIEAMLEILDTQRSFISNTSHSSSIEFIALDRDFHFELLKAAGNSEIIRTYDRLQTRQRIIGAEALSTLTRREAVCLEHQAIVDSLKSGDVSSAETAISEHIAVTEAHLLMVLTE